MYYSLLITLGEQMYYIYKNLGAPNELVGENNFKK